MNMCKINCRFEMIKSGTQLNNFPHITELCPFTGCFGSKGKLLNAFGFKFLKQSVDSLFGDFHGLFRLPVQVCSRVEHKPVGTHPFSRTCGGNEVANAFVNLLLFLCTQVDVVRGVHGNQNVMLLGFFLQGCCGGLPNPHSIRGLVFIGVKPFLVDVFWSLICGTLIVNGTSCRSKKHSMFHLNQKRNKKGI